MNKKISVLIFFYLVCVSIAYNVSPLHDVADESELSSVCQDRTFFVKTNVQLTEN